MKSKVSRIWAIVIIFFSTNYFTNPPVNLLFNEIPSDYSGIHFNNKIRLDNIKYGYGQNSSGVGVGDFNNDGLVDIFFSGNEVANKLYLNLGKFTFKDISEEANISGHRTWGTGVSIVDINGDGLLDIYVCHSGDFSDLEKLSNELFINQGSIQGIPSFKESAKEYGLDLPGTHTTQVAFFDYDKDGDLDAFVLNHGLDPYKVFPNAASIHQNVNKLNTNLFLQNNNGYFTDISEKAGIIASNLNFGLGVIVCDMNKDGWPDIYCTNDYNENDFFYINQKNGTFLETGRKSFNHFSLFSMGADAADFNNDGLVDLITADMKAESNYRQKISMMSDNEDDFNRNINLGFKPQFMRNMLQVNQGNDQLGVPHFAEIGQLSGVAATDWSWSPLFADFDNDGWQDLFISSGYADSMSLDSRNRYLTSQSSVIQTGQSPKNLLLPFKTNSSFYKNNKTNSFKKVTNIWKPQTSRMSYAAAYADFDNDGALDLIISNLNDEPTLLRNLKGNKMGNYLSVSLKQEGINDYAIGAKVKVTTGTIEQLLELSPIRGYQSSQDYTLHFGLGTYKDAKIQVIWPDGSMSDPKIVSGNQHLEIEKKKNNQLNKSEPAKHFSFTEIRLPKMDSFISRQSEHPDFKYVYSLPYKISDFGQVVAAGDINNDGFTDYFVGGEAGSGKFFMLGQSNGGFSKYNPGCFDLEDDNTTAIFIDADKDGKLDLLVESRRGRLKQPQLYNTDTLFYLSFFHNTGNGVFLKLSDVMPHLSPFKTMAAGDIDNDGDLDLFIGGYPTLTNFGKHTKSYILRNDSQLRKIKFSDVTSSVLPVSELGMITSAEWRDMDNDHFPELLLAGEWMSCKFMKNNKGILSDESVKAGMDQLTGLWTFIHPLDVNGDGFIDLIAGNIGQNNSFNIAKEHPAKLNMIDFHIRLDGKPAFIPIMSNYYEDGGEYPSIYRDDLLSVSQRLRSIFNTYSLYASSNMKQIFEKTGATLDTVFTCTTKESGIFMNDGNNHFTFTPFPLVAQLSRVNTVTSFFTNKSTPDLLVGGNFFGYRVQFGRQDALPIVQLKRTSASYSALLPNITGLFTYDQVYHIYVYSFKRKKRILLFKKNEAPQLFEYNEN